MPTDRGRGRGGRAYRRVKPLGARLLPIRDLYTDDLHCHFAPRRPIWGATELRRRSRADMWAHRTKTVGRRCDTIHPSIHLCANPNIPSGTPFNGTPVAILSIFPTLPSPLVLPADSSDVTTQMSIAEWWRVDRSIFFFWRGLE